MAKKPNPPSLSRQLKARLDDFVTRVPGRGDRSRGWTEVARQLGVSHSTLSPWRNMRSSKLPSLLMARRIAAAFNLDLNKWLLDEGQWLRGSPANAGDAAQRFRAELVARAVAVGGIQRKDVEEVLSPPDKLLTDLVEWVWEQIEELEAARSRIRSGLSAAQGKTLTSLQEVLDLSAARFGFPQPLSVIRRAEHAAGEYRS